LTNPGKGRDVNMTPRERMLAVLSGEEPDKIPVFTYYHRQLAEATPGGWYRRLTERGLGTFGVAGFYTPRGERNQGFCPYLPDVTYSQVQYIDKGIRKYRHTYETPVGTISCVNTASPETLGVFIWHTEEPFVKEPSDWRVANFISRGVLDRLAPDYQSVAWKQDELGESGVVLCFVEKTPWQKAWVEWASMERAALDFADQAAEIQEYLDIERRLHARIAEFVAECPCPFIDVGDNITNTVSPDFYRKYSLPIYELYSRNLAGTGKVLGVHMDGRLRHLRREIADSPIQVIESFTVPPVGDVSLTEVRKDFPGKIVCMNCAPHLHWAPPNKVREGYEAFAHEWGGKSGLILNRSETVPLDRIEEHLGAALDAFGY
jgi:hypothetical protein